MPKDARKKDTREKITLGGLIVKAGLREADRAFLLGVLINAGKLDSASAQYAHTLATGRATFADVKGPPTVVQAVLAAALQGADANFVEDSR